MNEPIEPGTLESLLEELLAEKHPPDLRQSILNRLHEDHSQEEKRWDSAIAAALMDVSGSDSKAGSAFKEPASLDDSGVHFREQLELVAEAPPVQDLHSSSLPNWGTEAISNRVQRTAWMSIGLVAACVLVLLGIWIGRSDNQASLPSDPNKQSVATNPKTSSPSDEKIQPKIDQTNPTKIANNDEVPRRPKTLSEDSLPFQISPRNDVATSSNSPAAQVVKALPDEEIIQVIDHQFAQLWKRAELNSDQLVDMDGLAWGQRTVQWLLSRELSTSEQAELQKWDKNPSMAQRLAFAKVLVESPEFAKTWSKRLASQWLGNSDSRSPERQSFEGWIADQLQAGKSLADIQSDMILAVGTDSPGADSFAPASHWLAKLADGQAGLTAERICNTVLDQPMVCSRCHDSKSMPTKNYWGLVAFLKRASVQHQTIDGKDLRIVATNAKHTKETYFEREDGTMSAAIPSMPDGSLISTDDGTLRPLAQWLAASPLRREANVNMIWKAMFGRSLVPNYGVSEADGFAERFELREFLASQMNAHREDLRQVATWIVVSRPFSLQSIEPTMQQYLMASSTEVEKWRTADRLFATGVPSNFTSAPNAAPEALKQLAGWLDSKDVKLLGQRKTSANPIDLSNLPKGKSNDHLRFLIHSQRIEERLESHIDSWMKAKMPWETLVDHAAWLGTGHSANDGQQELARDVLTASNGEKRTALIRILLTELGYF